MIRGEPITFFVAGHLACRGKREKRERERERERERAREYDKTIPDQARVSPKDQERRRKDGNPRRPKPPNLRVADP